MSDTFAIVRDFFLLKREALDQGVEAFRALHAIAHPWGVSVSDLTVSSVRGPVHDLIGVWGNCQSDLRNKERILSLIRER